MPEANALLRAARMRMESPSSPGEPMSRQELAEAVNAQVYRSTGKITTIDANHIGKWERGVFRWPAAYYRAALRAILDVATDAELGFVRPSRGNSDDVNRKTFLKTTLGVGAGVLISSRGPIAGTDADELLRAVAGPTVHYRRIESTVSSAQLAPAVEAHWQLATGIVRASLRTSSGYAVLAELAGLAAWLAADQAHEASARKRYAQAVAYSERAHHPLLTAYMTASLGHFAIEAGDARQGLALVSQATAQMDGTAPPSARAWLACLRAVGHAALGETAPTLSALRDAERLTDRPQAEPHWPWVFVFDPAKVARYQASALGRLGDLRAARAAYQDATPALTNPKPRALAQLDQARVLAAAGLVGDGCNLALDALRIGQAYDSERVTAGVRAFRASLPHRTTEARELDDLLAVFYETETP